MHNVYGDLYFFAADVIRAFSGPQVTVSFQWFRHNIPLVHITKFSVDMDSMLCLLFVYWSDIADCFL